MKNKSDNKNIKKKLLRVVLYVLLIIALIPIVITLIFQSSVVQSMSARLAAEILSKKLEQKVSINSIKIGFFSGVNIYDFNVDDHHNNKLIGVGKLTAMPVFTNFSFSQINFHHIEIDNAVFNMGSYENESTTNLAMLLKKIKGNDSTSNSFGLYSKKVSLTNSSFNLFNNNKNYNHGEKSMDYANILIDSINIHLKQFKIINDSLNFRIVSLRAKENSGIDLKNMSADFILSSRGLYTNNTLLHINNSTIDADFGMEYSSYGSFSYYIDSVHMIGNIRPTTIDMADIGHFSDVLYKMPNILGVTGELSGTVKELSGKNIRIKYGTNTRVSGDISFKGLPNFYGSLIGGKNLRITSNPEDIKSFYLPIAANHIDVSNIIPNNEQVTVIGDFNGYYEDFETSMAIMLKQGTINSEITFKNTPTNIDFKTTFFGDSIDIGNFINKSSLIGSTSFNIDVSGNGESLETVDYKVSGLLTNTEILDYEYRRIGIDGEYSNDSIIAKLRVGDQNLMLDASLESAMKKTPSFSVSSEIVLANLNKLNLWSDQHISVSTNINALIVGSDINDLIADIALRKSKLTFKKNSYLIDSLILTKHKDEKNNTLIQITSDIINVKAIGEYNLTTVSNSFFDLFDNYFDIKPERDTLTPIADENISIDINIPKPKIFTKQFLHGIAISPNARLISKFDFSKMDVNLDLKADKIEINDVKLDSNRLLITNELNHLIAEFSIKNIILKDSTPTDSVVFGIDDFSISTNIGNDSIIYGINWDNRNHNLKNSGILEGYISKVYDTTVFNIGKANVFVNDVMWSIDTNNRVIFNNGNVLFHDFSIFAGNSEFSLIGAIPKAENDSLTAHFKDWELSNFDIITKPMNIDLDGIINGSLNLSLKNDNPTLISNINIKNLGLNKEYLGDASILNTWDNSSNSIYINSSINRKGNVGEGEVFMADGYYHPTKKTDNLHIDVSFNRFKLKTIEPFLSAFVNDMEGTTSGNISIKGGIKKPIITGSAKLQRAGMRVVYLNTKYSFTKSIDFVENGIKFDKLVIYDTLGNQAQINGSLTYNEFSDPKFNVSIKTDGLLFFNTSQNMNDLYYGSAVASGDIKLTGSPSDVDLDIDVKTKKGTSVILPLNYSVEISDKDYIIFVTNDIDTISEKKVIDISESNTKDALSYNINVDMEVTPIAEVGINLPDDMGTIEARGTSNLSIDVNSNGKFTLVGDYIVEDGLFRFKIGNLVSKRFSLVKGGRISWSGNPYSANVSIKGMYKVKTSLSSLGIVLDSTASYKNKVTVECYVVLTDELLNPNIKFEISIPDLDPDQQRAVFSELDTTNTAMMNQQMISLLVLGTFNFNNAANVSLQSSYYNVIANQLSSMLSQISENVDVGLNYKPGDNVSQQEFEVALSTQLFDDRLTIDGNFGMTYDRTEQSASNIVGDVDIGYKLTPDGQWILKVFNHSNVNSYYNNNNYDQTSPYTQGVGIAFRKDFNNIADLFKSNKKTKREEKRNKESITKEDEENGNE